MAWASSCDGGVDDLGTERLCPRWITSAPAALDQAAHDVDGGVVAVEEGGGGDHAHLVGETVAHAGALGLGAGGV